MQLRRLESVCKGYGEQVDLMGISMTILDFVGDVIFSGEHCKI
jgi:hypothetical protein